MHEKIFYIKVSNQGKEKPHAMLKKAETIYCEKIQVARTAKSYRNEIYKNDRCNKRGYI